MELRVVISGASSGLGLALTQHYLQQGAQVAVYARRAELLQSLYEQYPDQVHCYPLDVRDAAALQSAATHFMQNVGVPDIVIANAGVSRGTLTEFVEDVDVFQQVMDINVLGVVKTFQPYINAMRANSSPAKGRPGGVLVGISSVAGFRGIPGSAAYSASKAALISYLESLRVELYFSNLSVVTICPGFIKTPMTEINPYAMPFILPADVAARRIAKVIKARKSFAVVPWQMGLVGGLLKLMPNWLYDWSFSKAKRKPRGKI